MSKTLLRSQGLNAINKKFQDTRHFAKKTMKIGTGSYSKRLLICGYAFI
jgi:hypothetical protein